MINQTEVIEMTGIVYLPQLVSSYCKHCNYNFFATTGSFKKMYLNKYAGEYHQSPINPFKVRCYNDKSN